MASCSSCGRAPTLSSAFSNSEDRPRFHQRASVLAGAGVIDLHQIPRFTVRFELRGFDGLRTAPIIDVRNLVHARNSAIGRAGFLGEILAADVFHGVLSERLGGITALLGAIM